MLKKALYSRRKRSILISINLSTDGLIELSLVYVHPCVIELSQYVWHSNLVVLPVSTIDIELRNKKGDILRSETNQAH